MFKRPMAAYGFILVIVWQTLLAADEPPQSRWCVTQGGAKADEVTDNTAAFQQTLAAAAQAGGGIVEVPAGRYRIHGTLSIPQGVTLQGTYRVPPTISSKSDKPDGSVLLAYAGRGSQEGPPFIRLAGRNSAIQGLIVVYPEWQQSEVPPVPYPPCVLSENTENVAVQECCFLNPYEAIKMVRAHRHLIRNVTGYPSYRGIYVDECYDIGHIENVHLWPFGVAYQAEDPYCKWVNTQGVAFELARTDWHYVLNTFCFGYGVGYKFSQSQAGATNGNFLGLGADSCRRAVLVEQAQPPGILITNGEFVGRWSSTDSVCVEIGEQMEGKLSLVNCSFWGPIDRCVWMRSPFGHFSADACHFVHWDNRNVGSPAIQLDAGKAIVQACTFDQEGTQVQTGAKVRSAILVANQAHGGFRVDNQGARHVQMLANEQDAMDATPEARVNYRLQIGAAGDGRFLRGWNGRERRGTEKHPATMRWSQNASELTLPVVINKPYKLTIDLSVPPAARSEDAGLYLGDRRLATLPEDGAPLTVDLPPSAKEWITLQLRCAPWVPQAGNPNSNDDRTLGVAVSCVTMAAEGSDTPLFDVNLGDWVTEPSE